MVDRNRQFESPDNPDFDHLELESSDLESELRQALRPRSAPPGFAARVMQQIPPDAQPAPRLAPRRARILSWLPAAIPAPARLAAVASLLVVILAGTFAWQQHQRRIAGERARRQVFTALQITHSTLQQVAENISSIQNRKDLQP